MYHALWLAGVSISAVAFAWCSEVASPSCSVDAMLNSINVTPKKTKSFYSGTLFFSNEVELRWMVPYTLC